MLRRGGGGTAKTTTTTTTNSGGLRGQHKFITGSTNFRVDTVQSHEVSKEYLKARDLHKAAVEPTGKSEAGQVWLQINEADRKKLVLKMRNAYYVIKNGRPFSDFPKLCLLDESKGLTTGKAYRNIRGCVEFLTVIAESIRIETSELLSRAKFLSLTMDGTTDVAGDEQENLYLRCCIAGEVINKYISTSMPLSATSEGVYQCLINEVKQNDIDMNKLVGFGSDGAATMMAIRNGVGTQLKEICPDITLIHCLAHRLELCFEDAIKKSQYYDKAQTLLIACTIS